MPDEHNRKKNRIPHSFSDIFKHISAVSDYQVISNNIIRHQHWIKITAYLPDNVQICGSKSVELQLNNLVDSCAETEFELCTDMYEGSRLEFIIDVSLIGRHSYGAMKVTLLCSN